MVQVLCYYRKSEGILQEKSMKIQRIFVNFLLEKGNHHLGKKKALEDLRPKFLFSYSQS